MALIHHFLLIPPDISNKISKYREKYIIDGIMEHYVSLEAVPKPIDSFADDNAGEILTDFYLKNKVNAVRVHDRHICKDLLKFRIVETYYIGFVPCRGLNYYGYTFIPWESLQLFRSVLRNNSVRNCYKDLVCLCDDAYKMKYGVLHCGI